VPAVLIVVSVAFPLYQRLRARITPPAVMLARRDFEPGRQL